MSVLHRDHYLRHLEILYIIKRLSGKQTLSQWRRELYIQSERERLSKAYNRSILQCSEGSTCVSKIVRPFAQDTTTLDKDMVWNPFLKVWICIDCYNYYYKFST